MISIRSSYHPIDAAILWCDLSDHEDEILQAELSHPGSLLKHFPQWPRLHDYAECIYEAILSGDLPATYLGHPITSDYQLHRVYWSVRRADLVVWFARNYPGERPAFLFSSSTDHSGCVSLNAHLAKQAELDFALRTIEQLQLSYAASADKMASLTTLNNQLVARLDSVGIPSDTSEAMHNVIVGALLEVTLSKSKTGQRQSIYPSQAALVEAITLRFPGVNGLSKSTLDRRFAAARRHMAQAARG
ncbi:hypothetical protein [Pseudomonas palmensis]|uniref:hypothetical protein n=1 Tax=Pseudomonas palmensis TaxID=2815362 RepID=UPI001AE9EE24|nr:hypothetical protein [Pseudomonas palmensis]